MSSLPLVAVVGQSETDATLDALCLALGAALYHRGLSLLCGGRGGVMEATARGFREARESTSTPGLGSGVVVGLLPFDLSDANPFLDIALPTGLGLTRNVLVAGCGQVVIGVGGGSGTLSELAFAWQLHKPICILAGTGGWSERLAGTQLDHRRSDTIASAATPESAADWALGLCVEIA